MKTLSVKATVFLLSTLFIGPSWADNVSDIRQSGDDNKAAVEQKGNTNNHNSATIVQGGIGPDVPIPGTPFVLEGLPLDAIENLAQINQTNHGGSAANPQTAIILQGAATDDIGDATVPATLKSKIDSIVSFPTPDSTGNKAVVDQGTGAGSYGNRNFSIIVQNGDNSVAYIRQNSSNNEAGIVQSSNSGAADNTLNAFIDQNNDFGNDHALIVQIGEKKRASIEQARDPVGYTVSPWTGAATTSANYYAGGGDNSAEISQTKGDGQQARIVQTGFGNNSEYNPAKITQSGDNQRALIYQTGDGSEGATIDQGGSGSHSAAIFQVPGEYGDRAAHKASILQGIGGSDNLNHAIVWQSGAGANHDTDIKQNGSQLTGLVYQTQANVSGNATINQEGATLNLGIIVQGDTPFSSSTRLFEKREDADLAKLFTPVEAQIGGGLPGPGLDGGGFVPTF